MKIIWNNLSNEEIEKYFKSKKSGLVELSKNKNL